MADGHVPTAETPLNRRQEGQRVSRAHILTAAGLTFKTLGYAQATIRDIARTAGRSTGAIFASWSGKAALYQSVYGHAPVSPELGARLLDGLKALAASRPSNWNEGDDPELEAAYCLVDTLIAEAGQ